MAPAAAEAGPERGQVRLRLASPLRTSHPPHTCSAGARQADCTSRRRIACARRPWPGAQAAASTPSESLHQLTSTCLQASLLTLGRDLMATHVLPHCSLRDLAALSAACRCLRALTAGLPEAARAAAAQRSLPPTSPVCLGSDVRAALSRQGRLAASLADPSGWRIDDSWPEDTSRVLSPDCKLLATGHGSASTVLEVATHAVVARLQLSTRSYIHDLAFSYDSATLAALFRGDDDCHWVLLLSIASGAQTHRRLTDRPSVYLCLLNWAPTAGILSVQVPVHHTTPDSHTIGSWLVLSPSGTVLAPLPPHLCSVHLVPHQSVCGVC